MSVPPPATDPTLPASPPSDGLLRATATELTEQLSAGRVGAEQVLDAVLRRCDEIGETVNPFALRLDEQARADARESDRRIAAGLARPLEGLPVSAKDSQWLAGVPTGSGSRAGTGFVPSATVGALRRLRAAGAVIFAKTTTSEFCYSALSYAPTFGRTANPHDPTRTSGGSSGGAAAQVAAYAGPVAMGGDGGGSIRIPAAFCGVVGHKPTFGAVSHEPSGPGWKSLIAIGPITRSAADAALVLDVLARPDAADRHSVPLAGDVPTMRRSRIAVSEDLGFAPVDPDVLAAFRTAVDALADAGAELVVGHPELSSSVREWASIATAEARWAQAREYTEQPELLSAEVLAYLGFGETVTTEQYVRAQFHRDQLHHTYQKFFASHEVDVLFTPTVGCVAFDAGLIYPERIGGVAVEEPWRDWAPLLYDANLAGLPACTVPIGVGAAGLPVGGQLLGPRRSDRTVLRLAALLQDALLPS